MSSYTYAWTFLQMPYAVVAVSVMSAVAPELAERWSKRDSTGFRQRLATGLRAVLAIIIPATVGLVILAHPAVALLLAHGSTTLTDAAPTGAALGLFAVGLPGFCVFLYVVRVLQSMQRTRTAFWLYLVENGVNIVLALVLVGPLGVRGLALSVSVAYSVAALAGLAVLRSWLGPLGDRRLWAPLGRVTLASVAMGVVALLVANISGSTSTAGLAVRVLGAVATGAVVYVAVISALGRRAGEHRRGPARPAGRPPGRSGGSRR